MRVQEAVKPDWYQALADTDTADENQRKRCRKGVDRTLQFLDAIIEKRHLSKVR